MTTSPNLEFDWAKKRWSDPLTGTEVVCISPELPLHFRNTYFRVNGMRLESNAHVTPDSRWGVFQSANETGLFEVWAAGTKQ